MQPVLNVLSMRRDDGGSAVQTLVLAEVLAVGVRDIPMLGR